MEIAYQVANNQRTGDDRNCEVGDTQVKEGATKSQPRRAAAQRVKDWMKVVIGQLRDT